jgi:hypothetical protein
MLYEGQVMTNSPAPVSPPRTHMHLHFPTTPLFVIFVAIRFVAHALGWWGKMVMFRDWGVCWLLSIGFEVRAYVHVGRGVGRQAGVRVCACSCVGVYRWV